MKWTPGGPSRNLEDRRGQGGTGIKLGLGGFVLLAVGSVLFRTNLFELVGGDPAGTSSAGPVASSPEEDREVQFVSFVLDDVQATWGRLLGSNWRDAKLVLFRDAVSTGCGGADAGVGPFYCPVDEKAYLDLSFFEELQRRFGAPGDFAQAYVLAHEIGHHVQHLLGTDERVRRAGGGTAGRDASVALELQADCYAGVWGHSTAQRQILEAGDTEEALGAAAAVGDDRLQRQAGQRVNTETFTHGSSRQRVEWFNRGFQGGRMEACDTFSVSQR